MISKNDILKFVRHVHKRGRGVPDRRPMHPRREWLAGLFFFLVITGIGATLSMLSFEYYNNVDQRTYPVDLTTPTYNQERANIVLEDMAERRENYEQLTGKARVAPVAQPINDTATSTPETDEDEEENDAEDEETVTETNQEEVNENDETVELGTDDELPEDEEEDDEDDDSDGAVLDAS